MKIVSVFGTRPEFIQARCLGNVLEAAGHRVTTVYTGQHYDDSLTIKIFRDLTWEKFDYVLGIGSGRHGQQTGVMLIGIEQILAGVHPDWVFVYGDTNSTLAGALAAVKLNIPVAHVEAGMRCGDRSMPEELNRIVVDHIASLWLCPVQSAVEVLAHEGIDKGQWVGDVLLDAMLFYIPLITESVTLSRFGVRANEYILFTLHRQANVNRLRVIMDTVNQIQEPVIFPAHPRTAAMLRANGFKPNANLQVVDPVGYLDMLALEKNARLIITDSGGVQREAYFLGIPCLTMRDSTEWNETIEAGWNRLVMPEMVLDNLNFQPTGRTGYALFGDGCAAWNICEILNGNDA